MWLTYEDPNTLLVQMEATMNSRPDELGALTPTHLLIGQSWISKAEKDFTDTNIDRLSAYHQISEIKQMFLNR